MRKQILAIAAASIMLPTLVLADGGDRHHNGDKNHGHKTAQFQFEGPVDAVSLAELKNISFGDEDVIVEGRIVKQLANGDYIFTDGKDEVTIEIEKKVRLDQPVNDQTLLRLYGEYEAREKVLEVERIQVISGQ